MHYVLPIAGVVVCLIGMYREGKKAGFYERAKDGTLMVLHDLMEGAIKIENDKFVFDGASFGFWDTDDNAYVHEISFDELEIQAVED